MINPEAVTLSSGSLTNHYMNYYQLVQARFFQDTIYAIYVASVAVLVRTFLAWNKKHRHSGLIKLRYDLRVHICKDTAWIRPGFRDNPRFRAAFSCVVFIFRESLNIYGIVLTRDNESHPSDSVSKGYFTSSGSNLYWKERVFSDTMLVSSNEV